jgi:hypothetical protein
VWLQLAVSFQSGHCPGFPSCSTSSTSWSFSCSSLGWCGPNCNGSLLVPSSPRVGHQVTPYSPLAALPSLDVGWGRCLGCSGYNFVISGFWEIGRADSPFRALTGFTPQHNTSLNKIRLNIIYLTNDITTPHTISTITGILKAHSHLLLGYTTLL